MLFNSLQFAIFLPLVLLVYFGPLRQRERARHVFLLVASWLFYAAWNPAFLLLLVFSTILDHRVAIAMAANERPGRRRALLVLSLVGNLGVLAFFKYGAFLSHDVAALLPWELTPPTFFDEIILPVGISFYTFQSLSYSIDVYRRTLPAERDFVRVALYVSFFPQLVAGPIVRATTFLPQLSSPRHVTSATAEDSLLRTVAGIVKKVCIADSLARWVDPVFLEPAAYSSAEILLGVYAFAFQIYFDFSGYSDVAIGIAGLLGYEIPENFDRPYLARSPREFWRRWHISLSTWLRDYLYIPLGGNRRGRLRTDANLFLTMLLGGLWHGAAFGFLVWGAFHGALLIAHRALARLSIAARIPDPLARAVTFHLACLGWIVFRAPDLRDAANVLSGLGRLDLGLRPEATPTIVLLLVSVALHLAPSAASWRKRIEALPAPVSGALLAAGIAAAAVFSPATGAFLYFQF